MKKGLRRVAAVAVATLVVAPALATVASATSTFAFDRIAGSDRYATSVATGASFGASTDIILASGVQGHFPDALSASYFAGFKKAPVMLTKLDATPANVLARMVASGAKDVWLVGGTGVISSAQETALSAKFTVHRLGGLDRYVTSEKVIEAAGVAKSTTHTAILATGVDFPDALGAGSLAYVKGMPVALTATNSLPSETLAALKAAGITNVIVLGGPTVVGPAVLATLTANSITSTRLFGADRAETSSKLADLEITSYGFSNTAVNVASGYRLGGGADALGGAALSGDENRPTLITNSNTVVGPGVLAFLKAHALTLAKGHIFGGLGAVSQPAEDAMQAAARTVTSNQAFTVTPTTTSVLPFGATATAANSRTYTAAVPAGTVVDVALFASANVSVDANGVVTFADAGANVAAVGTVTGATITQVNGVIVGAATKTDVTSTGTVTFTVTSTSANSVVPVVFSKADGNDQVDLTVPLTANTDPKTSTDSIGVGGVTIFTVAQAALGASPPTVVTFDTTQNYFTSSSALYNYDANDTYQFGGQPITMTQFEAALAAGDVLSVSYSPTASGVSVFNITTEATPAAVTAISAAAVNVDNGATINDVQVTYTQPAANASGVTYSLQRKLTTGGTFATVTTATQAAGSTATEFVFTDKNLANASGGYTYRVEATSPISSIVTDGTASGSVVIPGTPNTTPPTSTFASETTVAGLANTVDTGDVFKVLFSSTMATPAAGATIRASDTDGTIADIVNGTNATFTLNTAAETYNSASQAAGTVLTVTITGAPTVVATGTTTGLQLPATVIDSANIKGTNGVSWDISASTGLTL